ncbi:MAG TPA: efflux RND transporter periplasmic adaptor subunit [Flavobacteriaceae bacterium]|jgi:RND family efflux transporter MFP subunit|nr:efflux RND transporter periplasmic adaptor subunit [Flavobacteriaceae bacterium]HBS12911.1 efflux RND transporter periplasmic adaptor subunit [Flavobacteriaceae bacterium]
MKNIFLTLIILFSIASCQKKEVIPQNVNELQEQKNTLKIQIDSLSEQLKIIDTALSKLDTSKKLQVVTVLPAKHGIFKHYIEIQGTVKADKNIEIRPEIGGTVRTIYVKEGQQVFKGQILVQLDDATIRNSITQLNTQLALATTTFERQERLWKQKIGSEMQFLQAKAQKENFQNNLASLRTQARKMKIIAPFSGVVDEIFPKNGELTSPQMPVVRLLNLTKVYVEAEVTEAYLQAIKIGTEANVFFPSIDKEINSKISQIGNYINPNNRSFKTRINLLNKDKLIKVNLLANLKILDFKANGIIIPSTLVQQDQNGDDYVFAIEAVNGDRTVVKKLIDTGKEYNNEVFITDGLTENDTLINTGARLVKAGDVVEITTK